MLSREPAPKYGVSQGALIISKAPVDAQAVLTKSLLTAGPLTVAGLYECEIATDGMNGIEAELMPTTVSGSFAPRLRAMRADRESFDTANEDTGANFSNGTGQTLALTNLFGRQVCKVVFTIPGGGSVEFAKGTDPANPTAIAEYHGI